MIKPLCQDNYNMKIIEDLGYIFQNKKSKQKRRVAIFECNTCKKHFRAGVDNVKRGCQSVCRVCSLITHGKSYDRTYVIWKGIKQRCLNENSEAYKEYGAKGIFICEEWKNDFMSFYNWAVNNGYSDNLSIDRIDNNGGYEPSNCRWSNQHTQSQNTRIIYKHNTSKARGVSKRKDTGKWRSYISINKKQIVIGSFDKKEEAINARNQYIKDNNLTHTLNL